MAELTLRMASNLIGYTFAEVKLQVEDGITPEQTARMQWDWNMRFLAEQEKIADEPVTEEQEAALSAAATEVLTERLPATKVDEESTEIPEPHDAAKAAAKAPWENKPEAEPEKPWQKKPEFNENLFG